MGLHRKSKGIKKYASGSFYISLKVLEDLNFIANFEGQKRSVIIEVMIKAYAKGKKYEKIKKRYYKKPKKKVLFHKKHTQNYTKAIKKS